MQRKIRYSPGVYIQCSRGEKRKKPIVKAIVFYTRAILPRGPRFPLNNPSWSTWSWTDSGFFSCLFGYALVDWLRPGGDAIWEYDWFFSTEYSSTFQIANRPAVSTHDNIVWGVRSCAWPVLVEFQENFNLNQNGGNRSRLGGRVQYQFSGWWNRISCYTVYTRWNQVQGCWNIVPTNNKIKIKIQIKYKTEYKRESRRGHPRWLSEWVRFLNLMLTGRPLGQYKNFHLIFCARSILLFFLFMLCCFWPPRKLSIRCYWRVKYQPIVNWYNTSVRPPSISFPILPLS